MQKDQRATFLFFRRITKRLALFALIIGGIGGAFWYGHPAAAQLAQSAQNVQQTATAAGVGNVDLFQLIGRIIYILLSLVGVVFLGLLLYAGFLWMTAGGDTKKVDAAQSYIRNAIIGLIIIASAWTLTAYILNALTGASIGGGINGNGSGGFGANLISSSGSLGSGIIEYHLPERNATDVPRNTPIAITFKQAINPASLIDGWTLDASTTATGLNAAAVKVFKTGDEASALIAKDARVSFTPDHKTFVIRPVSYLGSPTSNVKYTVQLKGGNGGIQLENGGAAFGGSFGQGYEWGFEVSTKLDITPPKVLAAIPYSGGKYARNIIVQITFNEAVDPIAASGLIKSGSGFSNIEIRPNSGAGTALDGEFRITNRYRTVEFLSAEKCGVNSCGMDVFCLPSEATLETKIKAATLSGTPPLAQLTNQGFDGVTDLVGNSLDGNGSGKADGPGKDDYVWSFGTSADVKLTPPKIIETVPVASVGDGQSNRPLDEQVTATFDSLMQASTFKSEAAAIVPKGPGETNPDTFWWTVGMNLLNESNVPIQKDGEQAVRSQLVMSHRPYLPSGTSTPDLNYYNPVLLSDLQDSYQNCFNPAGSVSAQNPAASCVGVPNCCNNSPQAQGCPFIP